MRLRALLAAVYLLALVVLLSGASAEAQRNVSGESSKALSETTGACTSHADCKPCVETCLSLPGRQPRCVESGMSQCRDGRCLNSFLDCSCNETCKPCEERCNSERGVCEPTSLVLCRSTGECEHPAYGEACSPTCNPPCNCKQLCMKGIFQNYCRPHTGSENMQPCPDGACVNPDEGESCNESCPGGGCAYCTEKCVNGRCQPSLSHICPDGSCRRLIHMCPEIRTPARNPGNSSVRSSR